MRKVILILLLVIWGLMASLNSALGAGDDQAKIIEAAKKEGRLIYYTAMTVNDSTVLLNKFAEKYPFIKSELYRSGGDNLLSKILMEGRAKRFTFDVVSSSINHIHPLKKEGFLGQYRSTEASAYQANLKDPDGFWICHSLISHIVGYNTRLVSAEDIPKTYADLLAPKWKGKISMDTLDSEWFGGQLAILGQAKAVDLMKKLAAQEPIYYSDHAVQTQVLATGEFPVAVNTYGHIVEAFKAQGAPIEWVPIEPVVASMHAIAVSVKAPHPNAARLFEDFALSKEGQMLVQKFHRIPARMDVEPDPPRSFKIFPFGPALAERINEFNQGYRDIFAIKKREK